MVLFSLYMVSCVHWQVVWVDVVGGSSSCFSGCRLLMRRSLTGFLEVLDLGFVSEVGSVLSGCESLKRGLS